MIQFDNLDGALKAMIVAGMNGGAASVFGRTFYVNSTGGVNKIDAAGGWGSTPSQPLATIAFALTQCTAGKGDVIIVAPGHAETITSATTIAMSKAGVSVIGLGVGDSKPTLTFTTATTAAIAVTGKNCTIYGLRFVSGIDSLVQFLALGANYQRVINCDFVTSSTFEATSFIGIGTTFDWMWIQGCTFVQPTDPAGTDGAANTGAIYCVDSEYIFVEDCFFSGNFETAIFHNRTTGCTNLFIRRCQGIQSLSGAEVTQLVSTATGAIDHSLFIVPGATDGAEANLAGTLGAGFFVGVNAGFGNDGAAGGQLAIPSTAACS